LQWLLFLKYLSPLIEMELWMALWYAQSTVTSTAGTTATATTGTTGTTGTTVTQTTETTESTTELWYFLLLL
jgi:hypothetical protein